MLCNVFLSREVEAEDRDLSGDDVYRIDLVEDAKTVGPQPQYDDEIDRNTDDRLDTERAVIPNDVRSIFLVEANNLGTGDGALIISRAWEWC